LPNRGVGPLSGHCLRTGIHVARGPESAKDLRSVLHSNRRLPLPDALVSRLLKLKKGDTWISRASNGACFNPGNWLRREVRPAANKLGIGLTGWHDFRHYFRHQLSRRKSHPKVLSGMLGHSGVRLAMDDYDYNELADFQGPMREMLHGYEN